MSSQQQQAPAAPSSTSPQSPLQRALQPQLPLPPPTSLTAYVTRPQLQAFLDRPGTTPYPALLNSSLCFASAFAALRKNNRGWAGYTPLLFFGVVFLGAATVIPRDVDNGASTATAWGVVYSSLFLRSTLASRKIAPIGVLGVVMASTAVYGAETYDSYFG
ncbi:hypothetical protein HDU89_008813 [Geranomyces variabilis]|nr:hypothetical protein HDU89_008813 [Geranomyces variabilis]